MLEFPMWAEEELKYSRLENIVGINILKTVIYRPMQAVHFGLTLYQYKVGYIYIYI